MRIDKLSVSNFKGFDERTLNFHPEFNLIVGENASGKTSILEAISVAIGSWFLGLRGYDTRHIRTQDVRLVAHHGDEGTTWEGQYPCVVEARGLVSDETMEWTRTLNSAQGRTTYGDARNVKRAASNVDEAVREGDSVTLPLISYYGTGRLWNVPRESAKVEDIEKIRSKSGLSRLEAYRTSVDPRVSVPDLVEWIARETWRAFQKGSPSSVFKVARAALASAIENASDVYFDASYGEVIVLFTDGTRHPFNVLSDGQRTMLALFGDLARKAATLNPHLGAKALQKTPGVVLIDELDLHLHPRWQRRVVEDLRRMFPAVQFVCTTHSPFLIQSLRSGEELLMLDGQPAAQLANKRLADIAEGIQGVERADVSERYAEMKSAAKGYLRLLDEAADSPKEKLAAYREQLANEVAAYADNPAFQAILEMKRAAKLGE